MAKWTYLSTSSNWLDPDNTGKELGVMGLEENIRTGPPYWLLPEGEDPY